MGRSFADHRSAAGDPADGIDDLGVRGFLGDEPFRAGLRRLDERGSVGQTRTDEDPRGGREIVDLAADLDAVAIGQPHVEHDHVGTQVPGECECLAPRSRLSHDAQVVLCLEERSETFSDESVIVHDQDLDLHRAPPASVAATREKEFGFGSRGSSA